MSEESFELRVKLSVKGLPVYNGKTLVDEGTGLFCEDVGQATDLLKELYDAMTPSEWEGFISSIVGDDPTVIMDQAVGQGRGSIETVKWATLVLLSDLKFVDPYPKWNLVRRVKFPLFDLKCNPEIPLAQIKSRRFDLLDRAARLGKADLLKMQEQKVLGQLFEL
jgi:hypothetical protein